MALLLTDADNTLWDTNSVFAAAQLKLLEDIETHLGKPVTTRDRLGFVRAIDQSIASGHSDGLRYPPSMLVKALLQVVLGDSTRESLALGSEEKPYGILKSFEVDLIENIRTSLPDLRPGVRIGLQRLRSQGVPIIVFTEGEETRCASLLERHDIAQFVTEVRATQKTVSAYRVMSYQFNDHVFMVGDQLDVDIRMAKAAEIRTIYFPSGFAPNWTIGIANDADYSIDDYAQVADIVPKAIQ